MDKTKRLVLAVLLLGAAQFSRAADSGLVDAESSQQALERQLDEERLAYQLYTELGELYPQLRPFKNIPRAEARHYEALRAYAARQSPDLKAMQLSGDFIYPESQKLYNQLLKQGKESAAAALEVGVTVEKLDIRDLDAALAITEDEELRAIYTRLRAGSERHLAAFSKNRGGPGKGKGKGMNQANGQKGGSGGMKCCGCSCAK